MPLGFGAFGPDRKHPSRFAKDEENLQIVLMGRFCKFPKGKTVNCNMQVVKGKPVMIEEFVKL